MNLSFSIGEEMLQAIMANVVPVRQLRRVSARDELSYEINERAVSESDFGILTEVSIEED
jgi:hypothetical protein